MSLTTYHNFALILTRAGARSKAIVVDAPEQEKSVPFDPPFAWGRRYLPRVEQIYFEPWNPNVVGTRPMRLLR